MENQNEIITEKSVKPNKKKKILIFSGIAIIAIFIWGGLTKAGYIPNFTNLEILCPNIDNKNTNPFPYSGPCTHDNPAGCLDKPVIYLYPTQIQDIEIKLDFKGKLTATYPEYNNSINGWKVKAYPDGHLINYGDNKEYSYLFWEGEAKDKVDWDLSTGFVVKGVDTREFLQKKLSEIGLTPKEYNEFIVYWYPLMKNNKYNLIHFAGKEYTQTAPLEVTPKPDSILRVFMIYKPLEKEINIKKQELKSFERKGFNVIEWGGSEVK